MIDIVFRVKKDTNGGELAVVSSLNNWDSTNPVYLKWQSDNWQGMIRVLPHKDFEYKYVIVYNKSTVHWESSPNRKMALSKYNSNFLVIKTYDEWENGTKDRKVKEIKSKSQDLRIMSFNIRYDNPKDGKYSWCNRSHLVSSVIRLHKPNFIGLQEVLVNQIEDLLKDLPEYKYIGVGREDGKTSGEYSPIFYKSTEFQVEDSGYFWLSETPSVAGSKSWKTACTRICTWGGFRSLTTNNKIYLFNTHLDHQSSDAQLNGVLLILKKIVEITHANFPVILTGDFNVYENSNVIKQIVNNSNNNGIKMLNTSSISKHKHHGTSGTFAEFGGMGNGELIDYIFLYDPLKCVNVLQHATLTDYWDNGYTPSDHRPIIADLQWELTNKQ